MKFMLIVKASPESEAGIPPSKELIARMMKFNEEMGEAGILIGLDGLYPSSMGARVKFLNGQKTVVDGPFAETKELVGGYWLINVASKEEAIEWVLKAPAPHDADVESVIEIRQVVDMADFSPDIVDMEAVARISQSLQTQ